MVLKGHWLNSIPIFFFQRHLGHSKPFSKMNVRHGLYTVYIVIRNLYLCIIFISVISLNEIIYTTSDQYILMRVKNCIPFLNQRYILATCFYV